jgi:hypothetical protein
LPFGKKALSLHFKSMIRKNRHSIVLLLVANLLVSNIGLSINWIYCFCKGQMQVSLFSLDEKCKKEESKDIDCCKIINQEQEETKPCCKKFQQFQKNKKPCTQKGTKYCKADLKIFFVEKENREFQFVDYELLSNPIIVYSNPIFFSEKEYTYHSNKAPPPRLYGRELLSFIQNFRC